MILGQKITGQTAMALAIQQAKKGLGRVSPNPPVGCVILDKNRRLLSQGYHSSYGKDHAEIEALKKIKDKTKLKGAQLYVTLEPCFHRGKTPSCAKTLIKYPLGLVCYGQKDYNPKTFGQSLELFTSRGIKVRESRAFKKEIKSLYEVFNYNMKENKTFVALKVASSLDGHLTLSGSSLQWVTGQASRDYVSLLRAYHDGVLIGVRTFLVDNPRLNSRKPPFQNKKNKVVILDPSGKSLNLLEKSRINQVRPLSHVIVVTRQKIQTQAYGVSVVTCPWDFNQAQFDLNHLKSLLYRDFGLCSLLVEGGAKTFSAFLQQGEAQILYYFLNFSLLGGVKGRSWTEKANFAPFDLRKRLKLLDFRQIKEDLFFKFSL